MLCVGMSVPCVACERVVGVGAVCMPCVVDCVVVFETLFLLALWGD